MDRLDKIEQAIEWLASHSGNSNAVPAIYEILNPPDPKRFLECDTCRAKPGSPTLCRGCLHNRSLINNLLTQ